MVHGEEQQSWWIAWTFHNVIATNPMLRRQVARLGPFGSIRSPTERWTSNLRDAPIGKYDWIFYHPKNSGSSSAKLQPLTGTSEPVACVQYCRRICTVSWYPVLYCFVYIILYPFLISDISDISSSWSVISTFLQHVFLFGAQI